MTQIQSVHLDAKSKQFLLKEIDKRKEEKITIIISNDEVFKKIIDYKIILWLYHYHEWMSGKYNPFEYYLIKLQ